MNLCNKESCLELIEQIGRQQKLIEAQRLHQEVFDHIADPIFLLEVVADGGFRYVNINRHLSELLGIPIDIEREICSDRGATRNSVIAQILTAASHCLQKESVFNQEITVDTPTGSRYVEVTLTPLTGADGHTNKILVVFRDVTERKRAAEQLKASQSMLTEAQEIAQLGSWDWDVVEDRVAWSEMAFEIYTPDERPADPGYQDFLRSLHPEDKERVMAAVQAAFDFGIPFNIEHRVVSKSKGVRVVHAQGKVFRDTGGKPVRMVGTVQDISERKAAEYELRCKEERLQRFFEHQLIGMAITSPEKGWLQVNDKLCKMLGYSREELTKLTWAELTHPDDLPPDLAQFEQMLNGEIDAYALEKRYICKDGGTVYANLSIGCVRQPSRAVDYVQVLIEDITERKRLEAERKKHLRFFESMDRVNRALQSSNDLETAMNQVLEILLEIFACERAYLVYPCDPDADTWCVPFERTVPEYPGIHSLNISMPMNEGTSSSFRNLLEADGPLTYGSGNQFPVPDEIAELFSIRAFMAAALRPKGDKSWQFGLHQCSGNRVWSAEEQKLFQEIGRRITDSLTNLLAFREVQEREQKFRILADSMPVNVAGYDLQLRKTYANRQLEQILATLPVPWLGKTPKELFTDGRLDWYQDKLEEVIKRGRTEEVERFWEKGADGSSEPSYFRMIFAPLRKPDGEITGALAIALDVTHKRQLELELIRNERKLRLLLSNTPGYIARFDLEFRRTFVSRAYEDTTKTTSGEVVGKTPWDYWRLTSPTAEDFCAMLRRIIATRQEDRLECYAITAAGSRRYFSMDLAPEFDENGDVAAVLVVGVETTELKLAEQRRVDAREEERKMLARELHDDLGQRLSALLLGVNTLGLRFGNDNPVLLAKIREIGSALGDTIAIVRNLLSMLRPIVLELGVAAALEWLVEDFCKKTFIDCRLQLLPQTIELKLEQSTAIYRIVQESLNNIVKHAEATKVSIAFEQKETGYLLEIEDDGKGFDLDACRKKTGSFGLLGIDERVRLLGGQWVIDTAPGRGGKTDGIYTVYGMRVLHWLR